MNKFLIFSFLAFTLLFIPLNTDASAESKKLGIASFVDTSKDPQSYVDRYFNELEYKEWFDNNYSELTIFEAVGLPEPDKSEPSCGFGTELVNGICQAKIIKKLGLTSPIISQLKVGQSIKYLVHVDTKTSNDFTEFFLSKSLGDLQNVESITITVTEIAYPTINFDSLIENKNGDTFNVINSQKIHHLEPFSFFYPVNVGIGSTLLFNDGFGESVIVSKDNIKYDGKIFPVWILEQDKIESNSASATVVKHISKIDSKSGLLLEMEYILASEHVIGGLAGFNIHFKAVDIESINDNKCFWLFC
jgi:hypothetical protein